MKTVKWACVTALTAALLTSLTPSASAQAAYHNYVHNTGTVGIGAIQFWDGYYKHAPGYDDIIPGGSWSGYRPGTAGFYVGPGYCVRIRGWNNGSPSSPPPPSAYTDPQVVGTGWWEFMDLHEGYDVKALRTGDPGCAPSYFDILVKPGNPWPDRVQTGR
ncbi:hypothetical protein [Spirillospora sp. CA-128828]|uniref:hypothetical protein n=1 Tax=Spirillospora sp. CA-128828 TaxID=3240033 RepID=UPI003D91865F